MVHFVEEVTPAAAAGPVELVAGLAASFGWPVVAVRAGEFEAVAATLTPMAWS